MATALLLAGCAGGGTGTGMSGDRVLVAEPATLGLSPGASGSVRFVLTSGGVPIAGQSVTFAIGDAVKAQGATLAASAAVTDVSGAAAVTVRAGLEANFSVRGAAGNAHDEVFINVAAGAFGSVVALPFLAPTSSAATRASVFEVLFFDGMSCREMVPARPPDAKPQRSRRLPVGEAPFRFDNVGTDQGGALVGRATDSLNVVVAVGCVDLSGSSLLAGGVVEVALPLDDAVPDPVGSFAVTSNFLFSPPLAAAAALAAPWRDLADCPLDPVQLWLDCTMDALSPATADDPLDCVPALAPGGEGTLGDALGARRGAFIVDGGGEATACRGPRDPGGAVSLDAVLLGLFGSPLPAALAALPAVADDAAHILDRMNLKSVLEVGPGGTAASYIVTHTLASASFGPTTAQVEAPLAPLALPILTAYTTASTSDGQLVIGSHGFTLRLGTAARSAFAKLALESRGLPGDAAGLVAGLAGLARSADGSAAGCEAMDGALCPLVGRLPGCLTAACEAGLTALAARLDAGFDAADGTGIDLYLAGSAPLVDSHGNGLANHLGTSSPDLRIAVWSADLRTALGRSILTASFDASRCLEASCLGGP